MTITPFWIAGAEQGDSKEFDTVEGDNGLQISTSVVYTGLRSFKFYISTYGTTGSKNIVSSQLRIGSFLTIGSMNHTDNQSQILRIRSATDDLVCIRQNGVIGMLEMLVNNVSVATANIPSPLTWHHYGLDWKASSTNGWAYFYLNGEPILSFDGNTGNTPSHHVRWGWNALNDWYNDMYGDDFYIDISEGELAPAPLPGKRFVLKKLISDVTSEFTPSSGTEHFSLLDEIPPGSSDYVRAGVAGKRDFFLTESVAFPAGYRATAIWPTARARKSNPDIDSQISLMITDGVMGLQEASHFLGVTSSTVTNRFNTQPNGEAWDDDSVNAITVGFVSSGTF